MTDERIHVVSGMTSLAYGRRNGYLWNVYAAPLNEGGKYFYMVRDSGKHEVRSRKGYKDTLEAAQRDAFYLCDNGVDAVLPDGIAPEDPITKYTIGAQVTVKGKDSSKIGRVTAYDPTRYPGKIRVTVRGKSNNVTHWQDAGKVELYIAPSPQGGYLVSQHGLDAYPEIFAKLREILSRGVGGIGDMTADDTKEMLEVMRGHEDDFPGVVAVLRERIQEQPSE